MGSESWRIFFKNCPNSPVDRKPSRALRARQQTTAASRNIVSHTVIRLSNWPEDHHEKGIDTAMKTRPLLIAISLLFGSASMAQAQVSFEIGLPNINIGFSTESYPELVPIPGLPVYYAPRLNSNFFFYDGLYWVYRDDKWLSSTWYNGPWEFVEPQFVPVFVLRVPVRYYRQPPQYFRGWHAYSPPRWGQHWGRDWERERSGWNKWDRRSVPAAAPLPIYQRQYRGDAYPRSREQQHSIRSENYRYQPRDKVGRQTEQQRSRPDHYHPDQRNGPPDQRNSFPERRNAPEARQPQPPKAAPRQPPAPEEPRVGPPTQAREKPQRAPERADKLEDKARDNRGNRGNDGAQNNQDRHSNKPDR